ncbi:surf-like protein [Microbotryomycetes sp. JL221]|nr:surf-like protein [Microbotryomycetes sp. JL221]
MLSASASASKTSLLRWQMRTASDALTTARQSARSSGHLRHPISSTTPTVRHASTRPSAGTTASLNRPQRSLGFKIVLGLMPVFTFGLGCWQIQRLQWKLNLIDQLDNKLHQPAVGLPARIDPSAIPQFAYRKVIVEGEFDYDNEIELGPRTREGELGYHVVTPLKRGKGQDTILVNRGFVRRDRKEQKDRPNSLRKGKVQLVGMLRDQEQANSFTPQNDPSKRQWVFANIQEMAQHMHSEPVLVDEIIDDQVRDLGMRLNEGVPVGRPAEIHLRNMHATYAATWYALSVATAFLFWRLNKKPRIAKPRDIRSMPRD